MRLLVLFLLLLAACTPAATPTAAPSARVWPTLAVPAHTSIPSTPPNPTLMVIPTPTLFNITPAPLIPQQWSQSEPLILYVQDLGGMHQRGFPSFHPANFTLLPPGDLYLLRSNSDIGAYELLTAKLPLQATCYLLNSIDQAGFFDYSPSATSRPPGCGLDEPYTAISVHAWRANSVRFCDMALANVPPVSDTRQLLEQYQPLVPLHPVRPGRLGVWVQGPYTPTSTHDYIEWPLKSYPLVTAGSRPVYLSDSPAMILTGADATRLYDALCQGVLCSRDVLKGGEHYVVYARPLLPNEFNDSPLPEVSLSCSPADGWIQAP